MAQRLTRLGVEGNEARDQVRSLTDRDLAYFSQEPERLQLAGAQEGGGQGEFMSPGVDAFWYELAVGSVVLIAGVVAIMIAVSN